MKRDDETCAEEPRFPSAAGPRAAAGASGRASVVAGLIAASLISGSAWALLTAAVCRLAGLVPSTVTIGLVGLGSALATALLAAPVLLARRDGDG